MSKAAELAKAGETLTNQPSGRKNIVTNGAMQVAQRGTSATGLGGDGSTYNTCDRWKISTHDSAGRLTMTQTADGPSGFANCIKLDCTTADTSIAAGEYLVLHQNFEGQDLQQIKKGTSDAEIITLSFYVKANAAFTFGVELVDNDNSRQITKLYNTTTGWVRHELTFPADTTGAFDDDVGSSISLYFWLHAGATYTSGTLNTAAWAGQINANRLAGIDSFYSSTDNNFFLTGVQLEIGSQATNFEHRSFGEELSLCKRYYQSITGFVGKAITTAVFQASYSFPTTMRAAPSASQSAVLNITDGASNFAQSSAAITTQSSQVGSWFGLFGNFSSLTQFRPHSKTSTSEILFDAEL
tara:strand:- start:243 stop:1307 length:1065 start_codon:yes stop_codon:yes gene_type:complete